MIDDIPVILLNDYWKYLIWFIYCKHLNAEWETFEHKGTQLEFFGNT